VLPILHVNGYKISSPTVLARITREELEQLLRGYGWTPYFVDGHEPEMMHEAMAATLDTPVEQIKRIQLDAMVYATGAMLSLILSRHLVHSPHLPKIPVKPPETSVAKFVKMVGNFNPPGQTR
jgi:hypothetical protein